MRMRSILQHVFALPLRQKLVAAGVAVAIGCGFWVLGSYVAKPPAATAVLSFAPGASGLIEGGAPDATKAPAVSLAQSILSEEVEMELAKQAGLPLTGTRSDVTEFRSRLELTQPSDRSLLVSYKHADRKLSAATADAVANLLVAWVPAPVAASMTSAATRESAPIAVPPFAQPNRQQQPAKPSRALRELETQLDATDEKLSALDSPPPQASATQMTEASDARSNTANEQLRILEVQLSEALKKLADLRVNYTDEFPDVETAKEDIAEIRQKMSPLQQASNNAKQTASPQKPPVDTSEIDQLRQNRAQLLQTIGVEKRHEAKLLNDAPRTANNSAFSQQSTSPAVPVQAPVRQPPDPTAGQILQHPFTLVRLAGDAGPSQSERGLFWYSAFAGIFCGLVYLGGAIRHNPQIGIAGALKEPVLNESLNPEEAIPLPGSVIHTQGPWAEEVIKSLSRTVVGRENEAFAGLHIAHSKDIQERVDVSHSGVRRHAHHDEAPAVVRENDDGDPKGWMAHTEEARVALSTGDTDTAIRAMNVALKVAPEELRALLRNVLHLDGSVTSNK
jgi:hypothetical protein